LHQRHGQPITTDHAGAPPTRGVDTPGDNLLQIAWRQRRIVIATVVVMSVLAATYVLLATPRYTARARLHIEESAPRILSNDGAPRKDATYLQTERQLISSMPILGAAIEAAAAQTTQMFADVDDPIIHIQDKLVVEVGKDSEILTISLESPYGDETQVIVQAIVDAYVEYQSSQNRSTTGEVLRLLTDEKQRRDLEYARTLDIMEAFQREHGALSLDQNAKLKSQLERLSGALTESQVQRNQVRTAYESAVAIVSGPGGVGRLIESQEMAGAFERDREYIELRARLQEWQGHLESLLQRWGENHRSVKAAQLTVDSLKGDIAERKQHLALSYIMTLRQQIDVTQQNEQQLLVEYQQQQLKANEANATLAEYNRMRTQLEQVERRRETIESRIQELSVAEGAGALNIRVLEPARLDVDATHPRKAQVLGMGLAGGLFLGALFAVARELTDQRFRGPQQIKAALGLPILASVPHMRGRPTAAQAGQIVQIDPGSNAAEAYRDLRTAVYFTQQHRRTKTILIASPAANDGKTTVASNLAAAIAQSGHEVLLVDADLRDPSLHEVYGVSNDIGLSRVLAGRDDAAAGIRRTAIEQLSLMTAGPCPTHPSELLDGRNLKHLLEQLAERFDYIVIDSPPVLAVTDTRIVANTTDATLLVLRPGRSNRKQAAAACESLAAVGANIMGIVANDTAAAYGYAMHPYPYGRRTSRPDKTQSIRAEQTHPHSIAVR